MFLYPSFLQPNIGRSSPPLNKQARDSDTEYWEFQEIDDEFDEEKEPQYNDYNGITNISAYLDNLLFPFLELDYDAMIGCEASRI